MDAQRSVDRAALVEQRLAAGLAELTGSGAAPAGHDAGPAASAAAPAGTVPASARGDRSPASYAQRRLWFLDRLHGDSRAYLVPAVLRLTGPLDRGALDRGLHDLVARHEVLRTTFREVGGELFQVVENPPGRLAAGLVDLSGVDLSGLSEPEREGRWRDVLDADRQEPFDLARGPVLRAALYRWSAGEHRLLLVMHHIAVDGWSLGLLIDDLAALYAANTGAGPRPAPPPVSYRDHTGWQLDRVRRHKLDDQLEYWSQRLAGARPTELPTDHPRPETLGWRGSRLSVTAGPETASAVREAARRAGTTPFAVLVAAFTALLHRYCGHDEIVLGVPVAGRTTTDAEAVVGMLANTVVLRADLSGDPTFGDLLARTHETVLGAYTNQDVPFELVVERLRPDRDTSRQPLFQIAFATQDLPTLRRVPAGAVAVELMDMVGDAAKFDLSVIVADVDGALRCEFEFKTGLFRRDTVARLADRYRTLLTAAVGRPDTRVGDLPLTTAAERAAVRDWSGGARAVGPDPAGDSAGDVSDLVADRVSRRVAEQPDAPAVRTGHGTLTYGELGARAGVLAARLAGLGCGAEDLVAVCVDRSAGLVVAEYGILRCGAAYVPLDPAWPPDRRAAVLAGSPVRAIVVDEDSAAGLDGGDVPVVSLAELMSSPVPSEPAPPAPVGARQLAYVVFTSGSTGPPKGVAVEHGGLANLVRWHLRRYRLAPRDRCTLIASPGFDASAWEIWTALAAGATLYVPDAVTRAEPAALARWLGEQAVDVTFLPTALAEAVLAERVPERLRYLLTGGDALTRLPPGTPRGMVVNHYGPTENTVVATAAAVDPGAGALRPPIGTPIDNVSVHVLDRAGAPVGIGIPGELYLGGAAVARGYVGDPAGTAERFVPDPFGDTPGGRLYRTGDLVRWLPDGALDFLGRADGQVKIRGHRVEPGEVEAAVRAHPAVREAAVVARGTGPVRRDLVAAVVLAAGADVSYDELRAHARARLPGYMVPAAFVVLDRLPVTASGKVDRTAVPWRDGRTLVRRDTLRPPRTRTEVELAELWRDLLGVAEVDRRDSFFDLGGHSFLALRLQRSLVDRFGDVSVADVFAHPTLAELAGHLDAVAGEEPRERVGRQADRYAERRRRGYDRQQARRLRARSDTGGSANPRTGPAADRHEGRSG